jgi:hypothetical protein
MPGPLVIRRSAEDAQYFARWGATGTITVPLGASARQEAKQLINATTETPTTWSVCLTATVVDVAQLGGGVTVTVQFEVQLGVGSGQTSIFRSVTLTAAVPTADIIIPFVPSGAVLVKPNATPNMVVPRAVQIDLCGLAAPLGPSSYQISAATAAQQ